MASRVRARRIEPDEHLLAPAGPARHEHAHLADRMAAAPELDLGSRIGLAADLQTTAGNAATAAALGSVRTDKPQAPADGVAAIVALTKNDKQRGLTRSSYDPTRMPLFKVQRPTQEGDTYTTRAVVPRLPEPDHEVYWPAKGRHLLGKAGKGKKWLEVSEDWSAKLAAGEDRHVQDMDLAYRMTWGRVRDVLEAMSKEEKPYTGATPEAARDAAYRDFKRRLPAGFRPEGDVPTREAQEAVWGGENPSSVFSRMWAESGRARDRSGLHTPAEKPMATTGNDEVVELDDGLSDIPGVESQKLMDEAWKRITRS